MSECRFALEPLRQTVGHLGGHRDSHATGDRPRSDTLRLPRTGVLHPDVVGFYAMCIKIVHLTTAHPPDDVRIYHKECVTLSEAGFDVVIVAPNPKGLALNGVRVVDVPRGPSRLGRFTRTAWFAYRAAQREQASIYHFHDPELMPLAWALSVGGAKVIYDVHEDLPRSLLERTWLPAPLRRIVSLGAELLEIVTARAITGIVAVTPRIAARFPGHKTEVIQNFPLLKELPGGGALPYHERPMTVLYSGTVSAGRGLNEMIRAIDEVPAARGATLKIVGVVDSSIHHQLSNLPRVTPHAWCSRSELHRHINIARIGLVLFHPHPNHVNAQPNKLFEYMMAGIPVIASDFPLWRQIVGDEKCGVLVDPMDVSAIARAIDFLLSNPDVAEEMGARGRAAVIRRYNWNFEASTLVEMYERLAGDT